MSLTQLPPQPSGDEVAEGLRRARERAGLSRPELAQRAETSRQQIERLEKGERELTKQWAERLAPHLGVSAVELLFPSVVARTSEIVLNIPVEGEAAAGVWRQMFDAHERKYPPIPASPEPRYAGFTQFAVKIIGDSMNRVLPDESFAICVPFWKARRTPQENDLVYVQRSEGGQFSATPQRFQRLRTR